MPILRGNFNLDRILQLLNNLKRGQSHINLYLTLLELPQGERSGSFLFVVFQAKIYKYVGLTPLRGIGCGKMSFASWIISQLLKCLQRFAAIADPQRDK